MFRYAHTPDQISTGTMTASTTAAQMSSNTFPCNQIFIENDPDNNVDIFIGNSVSQPLQLQPGQSLTCDINTITGFWIKSASSTALVNWLSIG